MGSAKCGMGNAQCGLYSLGCKVFSVKWGVYSLGYKVWSVECKVGNIKGGGQSGELKMFRVCSTVWIVKCGVESLEWGV